MITISGAIKSFSPESTIGPIDLTIPSGGITALIGPNGAGKSTLLTMMGRLTPMDAGSIVIGGHDIARSKSSELARVVSILRQENHFITRLTVRQLVGLGRFPHSRGRLTPHDERLIDRALEFLHLGDYQHRYLDALSGGQRQRAYVAMVLAQDTDYVLLDEPLNNLDMPHSVQMMQHLRLVARELGKTVVIVMHDINFASVYADRIVAMRDGRVVCHETPNEVMTSRQLAEVYDMHIPIHEIEGQRLGVYFWAPELPSRDGEAVQTGEAAAGAGEASISAAMPPA